MLLHGAKVTSHSGIHQTVEPEPTPAQCFGNLKGAPGGFFRAVMEDQCHPVTGRQPEELFVGRFAHQRRRQRDLVELVEPLLLLETASLEAVKQCSSGRIRTYRYCDQISALHTDRSAEVAYSYPVRDLQELDLNPPP